MTPGPFFLKPINTKARKCERALHRTSQSSLQLLFLFISQESLQGSRHCGNKSNRSRSRLGPMWTRRFVTFLADQERNIWLAGGFLIPQSEQKELPRNRIPSDRSKNNSSGMLKWIVQNKNHDLYLSRVTLLTREKKFAFVKEKSWIAGGPHKYVPASMNVSVATFK